MPEKDFAAMYCLGATIKKKATTENCHGCSDVKKQKAGKSQPSQ